MAYSPIYEWGLDGAGTQSRTEVNLFTGQVHNRFATPAELRRQDLNLDKHVNSVPCYHYTTSEWLIAYSRWVEAGLNCCRDIFSVVCSQLHHQPEST